VANDDDVPALEAIGHVASGEREQDRRRKLREANVPEAHRAARERVDLPADGDTLHLHGHRREQHRQRIEPEVAELERAAGTGAKRVGSV